VTPGAFQTKLNGDGCVPSICGGDVFVAKLNPRTSEIVYATYVGDRGSEFLGALAVDAAGNAYVVGSTYSSGFPVTPGAFQTTFHANSGIPGLSASTGFVAKLNASGSGLVYATFLGGSSSDVAYDVAVDAAGAAYVTGQAESTDFPTTPGAYRTAVGQSATFLTKINPDGRSLAFSTGLSPMSGGFGVAVDSAGRAIVGGATWNPAFPTVGEGLLAPSSYFGQYKCYDSHAYCRASFLTMLDARGQQLVWSGLLGATDGFGVTSIGLDSAGNVYAGGEGDGIRIPGYPGGGTALYKVAATGPPPTVTGVGVVNSATYLPRVVRGSLISIFGTGIAPVNGVVVAPSFPLPTELAGVSVWIDGDPAPILSVSNVNGREQINIQAPFLVIPGYSGRLVSPSSFTVKSHGAISWAELVTSPAPQAGIFVASDGTAAVLHSADYSLVTASNPARAGEVILVYATALWEVGPPVDIGVAAPVSPLSRTVYPVTAQIGGVDAQVQFAGLAPGYAGLYQVNLLVPKVPAGTQTLTIAEVAAAIDPSPSVQIPMR
jgi:uncharacterized protein (TIGR03437 family)